MKRALVVEPPGDRASLSVARALAEAGWSVGVATQARRGLADASRRVNGRHRVPILAEDPAGFVEGVAAAIRAGDYDFVLAGGGDGELLALSASRDALPARLPYPDHETIVGAADKLRLGEAARAIGLAAPATVAAERLRDSELSFPAVLKPRHSADPVRFASSRGSGGIAPDRATAVSRADSLIAAGIPSIAQEWRNGTLMAISVVADRRHRIVAVAQQRSDRIWPPSEGVSARAHTTAVDRRLAERFEALLAELGWWGIAQAQLIRPGAGDPLLIDFNPRPYGSLALALGAGTNLPAIWLAVARGEAPPAGSTAVPGIRYQWLEGDLRWVLSRRAGPGAIGEALRFARGAVHSVWRSDDPRPALRYLRLRLAERLGRIASAIRTRARRSHPAAARPEG